MLGLRALCNPHSLPDTPIRARIQVLIGALAAATLRRASQRWPPTLSRRASPSTLRASRRSTSRSSTRAPTRVECPMRRPGAAVACSWLGTPDGVASFHLGRKRFSVSHLLYENSPPAARSAVWINSTERSGSGRIGVMHGTYAHAVTLESHAPHIGAACLCACTCGIGPSVDRYMAPVARHREPAVPLDSKDPHDGPVTLTARPRREQAKPK